MELKMYQEILLKYYSLSAWLAGEKKKQIYTNGTVFLLGNLILFNWASFVVFLLFVFPFKIEKFFLIIVLLLSAYLIFYGFVSRSIIVSISEKGIKERFYELDNITRKNKAWMALLILLASFIFLQFMMYSTFQGYLLY
jgi:hypothetical protein